MSTKRDGVSCYDKAGEDEELFCIRAQDVTGPETIAYWIMRNIQTAPYEKLRNALECALRMRFQQQISSVTAKPAD